MLGIFLQTSTVEAPYLCLNLVENVKIITGTLRSPSAQGQFMSEGRTLR